MTGARRTPRPTNSAEKVARIADVFNIATGDTDGLEGTNGHHATAPEVVPEVVPETPLERMRRNLRRGDEVLNKPPVTWLVDNWIPHDSLGMIYGPPGCGKSFMSLALALEVARGGEFLGTKFDGPAPVLYVAAERGRVLGDRQRAWRQFNNCAIPETFHELEDDPQIRGLDHLAALLTIIAEVQPLLVIIDTLAMTTAGIAENDGTEWGVIGEHLQQIVKATTGGTVIAIHHTGKDSSKGPRGHTVMDGRIDYTIEVSKADTGAEPQIKAQIRKLNHGAHPEAEYFRLQPVDLPPADGELFDKSAAVLMPSTYRAVAETREAALLEVLTTTYLHDGAAMSELMQEMPDLSRSSITRALQQLQKAGQVEKKGQTNHLRYHLSSDLKMRAANTAQLIPE